LGSTPATQWYKVRPCRIKTQEVAVFCRGCIRYQAGNILLDGRLLHNRLTDPDVLCRRLLGLTPAIQWYKVCPCRIETREIAVFCGGCIRYQPGNILLDGRYLHNRLTDFDALCGRLLGSPPATQWYRIHLSATFTHDFTGTRRGGSLRRPEGGLELERVFCQKAAYEYRGFYVD